MIRYVTSMSRDMYDQYGKEMLDTFVKNWPQGELLIYSEDPLPIDQWRPDLSTSIHLERLQDVPGYLHFMRSTEGFPIFSGIVDNKRHYQFDVRAFVNKVFAQCAAALDYTGRLFWIDADTVTEKSVPEYFLEKSLEMYPMAVMRRKTWHLCSSFVGWDMGHEFCQKFFQQYYDTYMTGKVFAFPQWDDAFVLEQMIGRENELVNDLGANHNGQGPYNVFDMVFAGFAKHKKGNLKFVSRYDQLINLVAERQPERIIEIGTWNGDRAIQMHQASPNSHYVGFDLFEKATDKTDEAEKNVKPHFSADEVFKKLEEAGVSAVLFKGDSKKNHEKYMKNFGNNSADLIFIDGGHSVETIKADLSFALRAIKPEGVIVLDDYYTDMPEEELKKFGCQSLLAEGAYELLPMKDPVKGGGKVQMAVINAA